MPAYTSQPNPLRDCGKPLFFPVADPGELGIAAPAIRLGEAVRLAVRSLSAMQKEAIVVSALTGLAWRLASDEGAYLDGADEAPCPLSFFSSGMVASFMNGILALGQARGIEIRDIRLVQDNFYTMKGSALRGTMTGGAKDVELHAQIDAPADPDTLSALVSDAVAAAPVTGLVRGVHTSLFTLTHNGREIATGSARGLGRAALADPGDLFERVAAAPGDWSGLIVHSGRMTPRTEETTTLASGSLADHQDRTLHVRVICTRRPDGVKAIEQQLFNPHGSIFHYLSDEAPGHGGQGLAPDAASLIATGIGMCFMTQFGRYAKLVGKPLDAYRIVQDFHCSGGASHGTGRPGQADPVETHCHLASGFDDDYARNCLDMAEKTCFLHALCRSDVTVKVRVTAPAPAA